MSGIRWGCVLLVMALLAPASSQDDLGLPHALAGLEAATEAFKLLPLQPAQAAAPTVVEVEGGALRTPDLAIASDVCMAGRPKVGGHP
jgi:hypothetical protein